MRIVVLPDAPAVAARAADTICGAARTQPSAWLGLPTGNTPITTYAELETRTLAGSCDLSRATVCAIDEFCAPGGSPGTNAAFYNIHLRFSVGALRCPDASAPEPKAEINLLAIEIQRHGSLDLCVLGIGENGHIAFNEPGAARDSRSRVVELTETTVRAHADGFGGKDKVPRRGMTLGVADLLESKSILVLATGPHKAAIVRDAIEGPAAADVPASWLQHHPEVTWLLDKAAAEMLSANARS